MTVEVGTEAGVELPAGIGIGVGGGGGAVFVTIGAAARARASPLIVDELRYVFLRCLASVGVGIE